MAASWECPSLPMIHLPMKDSSKVTFLALKPVSRLDLSKTSMKVVSMSCVCPLQMIAAHYEEEPESFNEEIRQLDQLREVSQCVCVVQASFKVHDGLPLIVGLSVSGIASHDMSSNKSLIWNEVCSASCSMQLALRPSRDYNGCSVLRRYFAQLHLLRARFPPETIGHLPIDFVW